MQRSMTDPSFAFTSSLSMDFFSTHTADIDGSKREEKEGREKERLCGCLFTFKLIDHSIEISNVLFNE